jgi:hypothetical protein
MDPNLKTVRDCKYVDLHLDGIEFFSVACPCLQAPSENDRKVRTVLPNPSPSPLQRTHSATVTSPPRPPRRRAHAPTSPRPIAILSLPDRQVSSVLW